MKARLTTFTRSPQLVFVVLLILAACSGHVQPPVGDDSEPVPLSWVASPKVPHDIFVFNPGSTGIQEPIDVLSWNSFIALNWPASFLENGVPDLNNTIGGIMGDAEGGAKGIPAGPTVWETFKETTDIFMNPPNEPTAFNATQTVPTICPQDVLQPSNVSGVPDTVRTRNFHVLYDNKVAFTPNKLIDQNGNDVWYEVRMNEAYFKFVVENGYYDKDNQPAKIEFPAGNNETNGVGAIRIKAAWKIIDQVKGDDPTRFYTTNALIVDETHNPPCRAELMGLVGMHIAHKTTTRPQWIWSTFEQIDNDPTKGDAVLPGTEFSFNDPTCTTCVPNQPTTGTTPTQIVREVPVGANAALINPQFQQGLAEQGNPKSVWQYYQLVNTQWPTDPTDIAKFGDPTPEFLANTVIEPFFQDPVDVPATPHSCIGCHGKYASATDFGFQLQKACSGSNPSPSCGAADIGITGPGAIEALP